MKTNYTPLPGAVNNLQPPKCNPGTVSNSIFKCLLQIPVLAAGFFIISTAHTFAQDAYCIPAPTHVDGPGIANVTIGSINNTTGAETGNYADYTNQIVNVGQGVIQQFSITISTFLAYDTRIWIDWNDDFDFTDAGEEVYNGLSGDTQVFVLRGTFTVPASSSLGNHRLRIGAIPQYSGQATPCYTGARGNYGGYEDYTINITVPPTCFTPNTPVGITIASGNANLRWTAPTMGSTPTGYEYAVTTLATPPESGIATTDNFVDGYASMQDDTYYYLHVRSNCGNGDYSQWVTSSSFWFHAGDTCSTAVNLGQQTSPYTGTVAGAEDNYTPPCGVPTVGDMYYYIVVPNGYTLNLSTTSNNDSIHTVFYGSCSAQTTIECTNDDEGTTVWENLTGQAANVYYVQDGWFTDDGIFTLSWTLTPPADCDTPRELDVNQTSLTATNISWIVPNTGAPTGYEYSVTTEATPPADGTYTTQLFAENITVTPNTNSYLHIRSVCGEESHSEWETYAFFSGYCIPENTGNTASYISGVTTAGGDTNFSNTGTGFSSYTDYTATHSVSTFAGGSFAITATHPSGEYIYSVWIDWNNNFDFTDSGERVISINNTASPVALGNIVVPAATPPGTYRMRIRNAAAEMPAPVCEPAQGEAEDYTLVVTPTPTCFPPYALAIEPADATTANLRWSPPELGEPVSGYEYVFSTLATPPAESGEPTTSFFIEGAAFNPAVSNYLYVRSNCGDGQFSTWATAAVLDNKLPQLAKNNVIVYKEGNAVNITSGNALITDVSVYDVRGSRLYNQNNINAAKAVISGLQIQHQVVIIQIATAKGKISKKIVF